MGAVMGVVAIGMAMGIAGATLVALWPTEPPIVGEADALGGMVDLLAAAAAVARSLWPLHAASARVTAAVPTIFQLMRVPPRLGMAEHPTPWGRGPAA